MNPVERAHWVDAVYHAVVQGSIDQEELHFFQDWFADLLSSVRPEDGGVKEDFLNGLR